jgi:mannose-6-phosphate isomerase
MKTKIFEEIEALLQSHNLHIESSDISRPWGGFFVISELQAQAFANIFFDGLDMSTLKISGKLSPKILVVRPSMRLSWQYHYRREELWKVLQGPVGIVRSSTNLEGELEKKLPGEYIKLKQGERHRLIGLADFGIVAEVWQHTDAQAPSDESDIIRLQDDFGR